jgi:glycosyltransferase involved in cell wall biosynthesis
VDSREAYKGLDQVLEVLPRLVDKFPRLVYLIAGSGSDVARLQRKTDVLKLNHRVIFAGTINETEKVDYYNLADAFVMPGRGEGFGVVYLEAMACGIPVVGSSLDGSKEALLAGKLGLVVNPDDVESLSDGIVQALMRGKGVPDGLKYFSPHSFKDRLHGILNEIQT